MPRPDYNPRVPMKWLVRGVLVLGVAYGALFSTVTLAMTQPPERFGQVMKHLPAPLVWGLLPGPRICFEPHLDLPDVVGRQTSASGFGFGLAVVRCKPGGWPISGGR